MFSFASKMLNTLIGEGQEPGQPQDAGQMHQPVFRPPSARPQGPGAFGPRMMGGGGPQPMGPQRYGGPGPGVGPGPGPRSQGPRTEFRPRLGLARPQAGPSHMMQRPPPPSSQGMIHKGDDPYRSARDEMAVDLSHLSEEERALIENVMAKAKEIEEPPPSSHLDMPGGGPMDGRNHGLENRGLGMGLDNRNMRPDMDGRNFAPMDNRSLGPSMDSRGLGPMDGRSLGSTIDNRGLGPSLDNRALGSSLDGRNMGSTMDGRSLGTTFDGRNVGSTMDGRSLGTTMDGRNLGSTMNGRNLGSNMDGRNLGSTMDGRNLGSTMDGRNVGSTLDGRNLGSTMDGRNPGPTLDGRTLSSTMDGRSLGSTIDGRSLGSTMEGRSLGTTLDGRCGGSALDGRTVGSEADAQHRQDLSMARTMHSSYESADNRQDSFKVCQDSYSSNLQKDNFLHHGGQQRQDSFSSSTKPESFYSNNTWEEPPQATESQIPCEYAAASAGTPANPDVRLSPGSPYSTSPASDDESSREQNILSEIKTLNESSLILNQTESEDLDKNKVNAGPSLVGQGILLEPFYDHSPGEVYTIPEEEDEISSPTSGDGVTSLRKRRLVGGQLRHGEDDLYGGYSRFSRPHSHPQAQAQAHVHALSQRSSLIGNTDPSRIEPTKTESSTFNRSSFPPRSEESAVTDTTKRNSPGLDHFLEKNSELGMIMKQQQAAQQAKQAQQQQLKLQQQLAQEAQQHQQQMQHQHQPQTLQQQQLQTQQQHQEQQLQQNHQIHQLHEQQHQTIQQQQQAHIQQQFQQQDPHVLLQQTQQQKQHQLNQQNSTHGPNTNHHQQNNPLQHHSLHQQQGDHKSIYGKNQMDHISSLQWDRYGTQKDYNQDHLYQQKLQQERMQEQEYSIEQKQFLQRSHEFSNNPLHRGKPKLHEFQRRKLRGGRADNLPLSDLSPILDVSPSHERDDHQLFLQRKGDYLDELGNKLYPLNFQKNQQQQQQQQQQNNSNQSKPAAGTISGMLADFSRALGLGGNSPSRPSPTEERIDAEHSQDYQYNKDRQSGQQSQQQAMRSSDPFFKPSLQPQQPANQLQHTNTMDFQTNQQQQYNQQVQFDNKSLQQQQYLRMQQHLPLQEDQQQLSQQQGTQSHQQQFQQQQLLQQEQQLQQQQQTQQHLQQQQHQQQQHIQMLVQQQQQLLMQQQRQKQQLDQTDGALQQAAQFNLQKIQEYHPVFAQNLTPQQQQMYQQHMQLQHHAQHLKKIRRSLPASSDTSQLHKQKKDVNVNMLGLQQVGAPFLTQPIQLLGSQFVTSRLSSANTQPIMSSSLIHSSLPTGTPIATPQSTPVGTPRGPRDTGGDSSDTLSETDSQKSLRMRRKLPAIPPDQEAAPLPTSKKRDRNKNAKAAQDRFRTYSPLRQYTDGGYSIGLSSLMLQRPSASETNLRKVSMGVDSVPRPGSALGLLQGSSVVSSSGVRIPTDYSRDPPLTDIVSCLPPDLRHLLGSYKSSDTTSYSKQLPLARSFQDDIKLSAADHRLLTSMDREDRLMLDHTKDALRNQKNRLELQRKMVYSGLGRSRKIRTHRRQLSDPKIHLDIHPGKEDSGMENEYGRGYLGFTHPSLRPPYKSYEYESIDDGKRTDWDPSQSYLASSYAVAGGALRETAINSVLDNGHHFTDHNRYDVRRYSDGIDIRRCDINKPLRKPRSWQPSPYGSDEDDDQLTREEKKAKIKAEIARRRQQIEENARLHEELLRLARLRESAELGFSAGGHSGGGGYAISSVLKSIDDLLLSGRSRGDDLYDARSRLPRRTPEDRSMDRIASTFRTDDYTCGVYERLTDFSPLTDFSTPHAMPLLPDMPTRSRKLLEDLGSSPITDSVRTLPQKAVRQRSMIH